MYLASFGKFLATKMGLRLVVLLIVGLGALYTLHLLAQDFMKISTGAKAAGELVFVIKYNIRAIN
jgi:hypothetical protein